MENKTMRIVTNRLVVGDVMASGEEVIKTSKFGRAGGSPKLWVTLKNPKTEKIRLADWNYFGTVTIKERV
jgi:hypothetical protein